MFRELALLTHLAAHLTSNLAGVLRRRLTVRHRHPEAGDYNVAWVVVAGIAVTVAIAVGNALRPLLVAFIRGLNLGG